MSSVAERGNTEDIMANVSFSLPYGHGQLPAVIDSGRLSCSMGMLVLAAQRMVQQNYDVSTIVEEIEALKKRLPCTYIVGSTQFMARAGHISSNFHTIAQSFMLHPMITLKDGRMNVGRIYFGSQRRAWKRYIDHVLAGKERDIDYDLIFVAYVGITAEDLEWIEEMIRKRIEPRRMVFQQASATTAVNCGPGTFGILYLKKGATSYNLSGMMPEEVGRYAGYENDTGDLQGRDDMVPISVPAAGVSSKDTWEPDDETAWYDGLEGIDAEVGIKNCGGEDAYKPVLEIFYESIDKKMAEIQEYHEKGDLAAYTVKVHALKSSARIIGALEFGELAQRLENAGKEADIDYIKDNHESFMKQYMNFKKILRDVVGKEGKDDEKTRLVPTADSYIIDGVYEAVREAAETMDIEAVEAALKEVEGYVLPKEAETDFKKIKSLAEDFDYDGILLVVKEREA